MKITIIIWEEEEPMLFTEQEWEKNEANKNKWIKNFLKEINKWKIK